ncbi:anti-sigma factor (plasmid) [Bartonella sp. HY329]|uniref:anti-sigma factor family protein n=1 Tax=unclassified Bartonella TaxID=2645622 RepID=UPI0021C82708|nr:MULTISPECIES: anti-sigma factor [unclassified Bartonella]UXM96514.1 anti-sigma factor [Bartonella sp. HY329]UXN10837.1 anti-sigma factor [Bartonella sp. HY328]
MTDRPMPPITEDDLQAFIDNRLDGARQAEVTDYLAKHNDMAETIANYRQETAALRQALAPIIEEPIPSALNLRSIIKERASHNDNKRLRVTGWHLAHWGGHWGGHWSKIAAAIFFIAIGTFSGWTMRGMQMADKSDLPNLSRMAAVSYNIFAPGKTTLGTINAAQKQELASLVSNTTGHPFNIPDLSDTGYYFTGGQMVPTVQGAAVLFMYSNENGNRLAILTRPMPREKVSNMEAVSMDNIHGYMWADAGLGYSVVSELNPQILHPLANEVRRQIRQNI